MSTAEIDSDLPIAGKTIQQWEVEWLSVQGGFTRAYPEFRHKVGLYRVVLHGQVMALGKGVDRRGGLAKRIADFRRDSDSARNHHAGELIRLHLDQLQLELLVTGANLQAARDLAEKLKGPMLRLHRPAWSVINAPFLSKA